MKTNRLEAFSDGVLAIIITIMVLELKTPEETNIATLITLLPVLLSYVISFIYIGSYWNNHHHLFQITEKVSGKILWANLHLLFWLSLIPFATSWVGEDHIESLPVAFYGFVLLMSAIAYFILQNSIVKAHKDNTDLRKSIGRNSKTTFSLILYILGMGISFYSPMTGIICYITVLIIWFIPNKKIEQNLSN